MEPSYLGLKAIGWKLMTQIWWEKLLAVFLLVTIVCGCAYVIYRTARWLIQKWRKQQQRAKSPAAVERHLRSLSDTTPPLATSQACTTDAPRSFGVYLGDFDEPICTDNQSRLLSRWEIVVLNPLARGVVQVASSEQCTSSIRLGRLDVRSLSGCDSARSDKSVIAVLDLLKQVLVDRFAGAENGSQPFTGVLLADFAEHFQPAIVNGIASFVEELGLDLWLELSAPNYLNSEQRRDLKMWRVKGVIFRNATIRTDGDRLNYFQMTEVRATMRAIASQRARNPPMSLMWETVDDGAAFDYAVVKRCYDWCNYNSALCWIGSARALIDAKAAATKTQTIADKPLGAMLWLKQDDITKAHDFWRANDTVELDTCDNNALYESLGDLIPDLSKKLQLRDNEKSRSTRDAVAESKTDALSSHFCGGDILSCSTNHDSFTGLGAFHLGLEVPRQAFSTILHVQRNLKELNLLKRIDGEPLQEITERVRSLSDGPPAGLVRGRLQDGVQEFLTLLNSSTPDGHDCIQIYTGLNSGFQTDSGTQYWGLYDVDAIDGHLNIYISNKTPDRSSTILHAFLSSRNFTRMDCYLAELFMYEQLNTLSQWKLPPGIQADLESLSPSELIMFSQRLPAALCADNYLLSRIKSCCDYQLMGAPTLKQLRELGSTDYLKGDVSPETLVTKRLDWLLAKGCRLPDGAAAVQLFRDIDARIYNMLMAGESDLFARLSTVIRDLAQPKNVNAAADIFALSVFCAFRKLALDEVFLEIMDRNPYPNHATDQAGCFAENFALGSRCDSFFDTTPRSIGRILSDRYRAYYMKHQPPEREELFTDLPTAYAAMQADADPNNGLEAVSASYRVTFLGIFAVPALIDIMMLTTIGRGLYLTTFMSNTAKSSATQALMAALVTTGGVGSWISSGGSYYLYANAFPAMSLFVATRFTVGVAIILVIGLSCMVGYIAVRGVEAGLIFFFYFAMLTIYLLTLAALSVYQVPGTAFLSGRTVVMACIPILFISPILTLWVQHDLLVYLLVLTTFLAALLSGARRTIAKWNTFYLDLPSVTDSEVVQWYENKRGARGPSTSSIEKMEEIASGPLARNELYAAVAKECNRHFWQSATKDQFVAKLARDYPATKFLMAWYCRFKRSAMPLAYSPTWNLTLKAALEMMTSMQKGLKLHSAFLHWRRTGADVLSGILYFIVALLDKWVSLFTGAELVGLSAAGSVQFRLAIGFGLCYYLIGAVSLDYVSQPLWIAANQKTVQPIKSLESLREVVENDDRARRRLYWSNLLKFFCIHLFGTAFTTGLMWGFEADKTATILYISYLGAYAGLLWYQFNKIFCGTAAAQSLAWGATIGLPIGIALHEKLPLFTFSGVISLAIATWISAFHSAFISGIVSTFFTIRPQRDQSQLTKQSEKDPEHFSGGTLEPYPEFSEATWSKKYARYANLPPDECVRLTSTGPHGPRLTDFLHRKSQEPRSAQLAKAFPHAEYYLKTAEALWAEGNTLVDLISARRVPDQTQQLRSIARKHGEKLHLLILLGHNLDDAQWNIDMERNVHIVAEALVQATCEHHLGMSHEHAMLTELLISATGETTVASIPEGVKSQVESSLIERMRIFDYHNSSVLRYELLGVACETEWDRLPYDIRMFLLDRTSASSPKLTVEVSDWLQSRMHATDVITPQQYLQRCDLGKHLTMSILEYAKDVHSSICSSFMEPESDTEGETNSHRFSRSSYPAQVDITAPRRPFSLHRAISSLARRARTVVKFFCISLTADPDYQRELNYVMRELPPFIRTPTAILLNSLWCSCKFLQGLILPYILLHGRDKVLKLHRAMKHTKSTLEKNKLILEDLSEITSCFMKTDGSGEMQLFQYTGKHDQEPNDASKLIAVNIYSNGLTLHKREERKGEEVLNTFLYDYELTARKRGSKLIKFSSKEPMQRRCIQGKLKGQIDRYDDRGFITQGSGLQGVNPVDFTFWYRTNARFEDELLRGEFIFPHITIRVTWAMPPRDNVNKLDQWIPFSKVSEATFIEGENVYHSTYTYDHKFHPETSTTLNGAPVPTPTMISEDWFHVLSKPVGCTFADDNPLLHFSPGKSSALARLFGLNKIYRPVPTSHARTQLWKMWKSGNDLDAITARWLDERALRSDRLLTPYWRARDLGLFGRAKRYLDLQANTIMARTDIDAATSSWVHIAYKMSDYYLFSQGGEATINTRSHEGQIKDSDDELHVMAMDTSTWPQDPGGVSACRRDMVNDLGTIRWHVIAESANDYGVPRFQIERNVQSLTILPLWGLDFLNPVHGLLENTLDSEIVERSYATSTQDIIDNFLPILTSLVSCARPKQITRLHIEEATNALVDLNTYFESSRNWNDVWNNDVVKQKWRELWLTEVEGTLSISEWWDFEKPTMDQLDQALNMWHRYLFIFSIPLPEKIPDVFQASHHFTGATYGVLCKAKRNCTLHVWDHCISFREFTTFMSSAVSFDSPFVNSSLISLGHLACVLLEHHADVVLPCCGYFNPGWEVELGSCEGVVEHRRTFARKIDPVVNGICNMEKFEPIKTIKTSKPTVVMLSHIQFVKDIKNAIMATDLIVNKWGFTDYALHIYGDMERAAGLSTECQELIAAKGLGEHCVLKGLGNASLVLQDAWLFLNSSISEGLPLAMGEAALTGVPVVCTDVGASFCVVTDEATGDRFSEVVSPNDCESLARAQINVLALTGTWAKFGEDGPDFEAPILGYPHPSHEQVTAITERMYAKVEQRRALGMLGRQNVLKNFSAERYLREHEQMLWIGKYRSPTYQKRVARPLSPPGNSSSIVVFAKEGSMTKNEPNKPTVPRLAPESWVSMPSALTSSSTLPTTRPSSVFSWWTGQKPARPRYQSRWTGVSVTASNPTDEEAASGSPLASPPAAAEGDAFFPIIRSDDVEFAPELLEVDGTLDVPVAVRGRGKVSRFSEGVPVEKVRFQFREASNGNGVVISGPRIVEV